MCKECKLYDSLEHCHRGIGVNRTYQRGSTQMYFFFLHFQYPNIVNKSGMTAFGDITTSDHGVLFIDVKKETFLKRKIIAIPSPF